MKKKVCFITGSRADYGILFPVMKAVSQEKSLQLEIIATCMHLMKEFGLTFREIERDGFRITAKVDISYHEDTGQAVAMSIGRAVIGFTKVLAKSKPQLVFLIGDRGEMLAAAIAANYLNIPVAHLHGGELSGHIDGRLRYAITQLSQLHFTATDLSRERIIKLGEDPKNIFSVGAPALDRILNEKIPTVKDLSGRYQFDFQKPYILLVQHPVSLQENLAGQHMRITLDAIQEFKIPTVVIYPNADAGGRSIITVIKKYAQKNAWVKTFVNLSHKDYLGILKNASVLIGNSSSGIIEAASFKVPVINIGSRQDGRERSINVLDVEHNQKKIVLAINKALYGKAFRAKLSKCRNPYGDGKASHRIVNMLKRVRLDESLLS